MTRPIESIADDFGLRADEIDPWGPGVAKVRASTAFLEEPLRARLVLVSSISPTAAGNGKTTVTIGLTQAARRLGARAVCALRQPSLGPVFGAKGGGTGGGRAELIPPSRINLHFTGDLHAITSANNLLAALVDNEVYFGGSTRIDSRQIVLRRALDMNDRFLRKTIIGLGGKAMGTPREDGFDITAASEVMAIVCLSRDYADLKERLGRMIVGYASDGTPVRAVDLRANGAMAALLRDALLPNLVATTEGAPALVHGGPFGNIAHGCNSIVATRLAMRRADVVFTEAGFGFDLGAEKFLDIKCRTAGIWPHAVVLVATLRALKLHGGAAPNEVAKPDHGALLQGLANLDRHLESVRAFGLTPTVALNVWNGDTREEIELVLAALRERGVNAGSVDVYGRGGEGALEVTDGLLQRLRTTETTPAYLYPLDIPPTAKILKIAQTIYGARNVNYTPLALDQLDRAVRLGYDRLPVCMAKTHLSVSDNAKLIGRPRDFDITIREIRISAGAGFLVALAGEILTMPGLPRAPHSIDIDLSPDGTITGIT